MVFRIENHRPVTMPGQSNPQIGVLGDVEFVPAAGFAPDVGRHVIGRAAGDGTTQRVADRRQDQAEPLFVFQENQRVSRFCSSL